MRPCSWEKGEIQFDEIVHKKWGHIYFGGQQFSKRFEIILYNYEIIQGIDFYNTELAVVSTHKNMVFSQKSVTQVEESGNCVTVTPDQNRYSTKQVFSGIFDYKMATQKKYPVLQQHFVGWSVKTDKPIFDIDQVTYMAFPIPQKGNTPFMYVLSFSKTKALVEYTLFSKELLSKDEYESAIKDYLENKIGVSNFEIVENEQGGIPMTRYDFKEHN